MPLSGVFRLELARRERARRKKKHEEKKNKKHEIPTRTK